MKKIFFILTPIVIAFMSIGFASAQTEPYTLFDSTHYGHDQGNWNVGLWRYFGDGIQIPYRVTAPCGQIYPGGPVNQGGSGRVYWGASGTNMHSFTIAYDPTTRQLDFEVAGLTTISESALSPVTDPQSFCEPPDSLILYDGGLIGDVNNLLIVIQATAGTSVTTCGPYALGCKNQEVRSSSTEISNLFLGGRSINGAVIHADLNDDPTSASFTNAAEVNLLIPDDQAWILTGEITVIVDTDDLDFVPKQSRVGMKAYGQHLMPASSEWDAAEGAAASVYGAGTAEESGMFNNLAFLFFPVVIILIMRSLQ